VRLVDHPLLEWSVALAGQQSSGYSMPLPGLQVHPVEPIRKAIAQLAAYHDLVMLETSAVHLFGTLHLLTNQPTASVGEPASPGKGSHPGEKRRSDCRFVESKAEGLGQAAEMHLLDRFLAREGHNFRLTSFLRARVERHSA
jgi:hypothetical protein